MLRRDAVEEVNDEVDDDNRTTTTHESLTSLVEDFPGFARDQPGKKIYLRQDLPFLLTVLILSPGSCEIQWRLLIDLLMS